MNIGDLIEAIPEGCSHARFRGKTYNVTKTAHNDGRSTKIYGEELGGNDFISLNFYRTGKGDLLKPCEMPEQKVIDFLRELKIADGESRPGKFPMNELNDITQKIIAFRDERDWAQFHNPKDMAIAISLEAGELLEHFLWKSPEEVSARVDSHREEISDEIADIAVYVVELADNLGIDLLQAMENKIAKNAEKYPAERVKGSSKKYSEYED